MQCVSLLTSADKGKNCFAEQTVVNSVYQNKIGDRSLVMSNVISGYKLNLCGVFITRQ